MIIIIITTIIFLFLIYVCFDNMRININETTIKEGNKENKEIKILHISDMHNRKWPNNNNYLLKKINNIKPDLVFITGDLIDHRNTKVSVIENFLKDLNDIINPDLQENKIFYVYGNHEHNKSRKFREDYELMLKSKKIILLKDEYISVKVNEKKINILGLDDPGNEIIKFIKTNNISKIPTLDFISSNNVIDIQSKKILEDKLSKLFKENEDKLKEGYNILLTHRPEGFYNYSKYDLKLIFAGHAHGGQIRLPFTNIAAIAPNQGLFPKYTKGMYEKNNKKLFVSPGIGNSLIPIRLFNPPELLVVRILF